MAEARVTTKIIEPARPAVEEKTVTLVLSMEEAMMVRHAAGKSCTAPSAIRRVGAAIDRVIGRDVTRIDTDVHVAWTRGGLSMTNE